MTERHLVVLSGGLDSTVCMALADAKFRAAVQTSVGRKEPPPVLAVTFDYGQRHRIELERAAAVARHYGSEHLVVPINLAGWGGSALTDVSIAVPDAGDDTADSAAIP